MSDLKVLGIDYSYTCPACCYFNGKHNLWWVNYLKLEGNYYPAIEGVGFSRSFKENVVERYIELTEWVDWIVTGCKPDIIALEDYAFMANGRITQLAENVGVLKAMLYTKFPHIPLMLVAPTQMKKFATGRGNANKDDIWASFIEVIPEAEPWAALCHPKAKKIGSPVADIADAYFLAQYGRATYRQS